MFFAEHRKKIAQFSLGLVIFESFIHLYDYLFFPFSIGYWGYLWGGVIASSIALLINAVVYLAYEHMKIDWLQARAIRQLADKESKNAFEKFITWHHKEKVTLTEKIVGIVYFVSLTLVLDPVMIALYHRKSFFKGMAGEDWMLLINSTVVACIVWLLIWEPGIFLLKSAYTMLLR